MIDFPGYDQAARVCMKFPTSSGFILSRDKPIQEIPNDSGWCLLCTDKGCDHTREDNIGLARLYEGAVCKEAIIEYLALPVGTTVMQTNKPEQITISLNDKPLVIQQGSYLQQKMGLNSPTKPRWKFW